MLRAWGRGIGGLAGHADGFRALRSIRSRGGRVSGIEIEDVLSAGRLDRYCRPDRRRRLDLRHWHDPRRRLDRCGRLDCRCRLDCGRCLDRCRLDCHRRDRPRYRNQHQTGNHVPLPLPLNSPRVLGCHILKETRKQENWEHVAYQHLPAPTGYLVLSMARSRRHFAYIGLRVRRPPALAAQRP